jgi:phosphoribosylpyrophosphate synthetase
LKDRDDKVKTESLGLESDIDGRDIMIATDDETATFSSAMGLMKKAAAQGVKEFHLGISHLRLSPEHVDMLKKAHEVYGMRMLHTTDSIPQRDEIIGLPFVKVHSLAQRWAIYINKVHFYESASDVFFNPKRRK